MGGIRMGSGLKLDRADTAYAEKVHALSLKNRNWLRSGSKASVRKMDEMLFDGAIEQLAKGAKTSKASVYVHLNHLRKERSIIEGLARFIRHFRGSHIDGSEPVLTFQYI
jgi:flagellin-specific chaperone FliS